DEWKTVWLMVWSLVFFFSSRRRHTSFSRDWSSDVCSSDLAVPLDRELPSRRAALRPGSRPHPRRGPPGRRGLSCRARHRAALARSEERRVGEWSRSAQLTRAYYEWLVLHLTLHCSFVGP